MYCPKCGNSVSDGLKYCNSCGVQLTAEAEDKDGTHDKMLEHVVTGLCVSVVFGFGILVGLVAVLLSNDVPPSWVSIIAVVYLAAVFGICFTLVRQITKLIDARLKAPGQNVNIQRTPQLSPVTTGALEEFREPVMSVTDHTTKTLDRIQVARK